MTSPSPEGAARRIEDLPVYSYTISERVSIERRGENAWAVVDAFGDSLNRKGEWEYEPRPSNRSDEYIARTRYSTPQKALDQWHKFGPLHDGKGA